MKYTDLEKVNAEISYTDTELGEYPKVTERVLAFRKLYPEGFIQTTVSVDATGVNVFNTKVGYTDSNGIEIVLSSGNAREKPADELNISPYERAETAAVGRALGFLGIGIRESICSLDEFDDGLIGVPKTDTPKPLAAEPPVPKPIFGSETTTKPNVESVESAVKDVPDTPKLEEPKPVETVSQPPETAVKMATDRQISMISKYYGNKLSEALSNMGIAGVEHLTYEAASEIITQMVSVG